jgi:hypothetical protein
MCCHFRCYEALSCTFLPSALEYDSISEMSSDCLGLVRCGVNNARTTVTLRGAEGRLASVPRFARLDDFKISRGTTLPAIERKPSKCIQVLFALALGIRAINSGPMNGR